MTIPIVSILLFHGNIADRPTDYNICDGDTYDGIITPDLTDRFVYGANDEGDVDARGGAETHTHENPNTGGIGNHSHTFNSAIPNASASNGASGGDDFYAAGGHSHGSFAGSLDNEGAHSHSIPDTQSASSLPPYIKAYYIMNTDNALIEFADLPIGAIIAWANEAIPDDWQLADGTNGTLDLRDKFVYGAAIDGDVGDTGGSETHTHTSDETDLDGEHSHTGPTGSLLPATTSTTSGDAIAGMYRSPKTHSHYPSASGQSANEHQHDLPALEDASNLPTHIKLYFIEKISA